jgi:hypothetical protein
MNESFVKMATEMANQALNLILEAFFSFRFQNSLLKIIEQTGLSGKIRNQNFEN